MSKRCSCLRDSAQPACFSPFLHCPIPACRYLQQPVDAQWCTSDLPTRPLPTRLESDTIIRFRPFSACAKCPHPPALILLISLIAKPLDLESGVHKPPLLERATYVSIRSADSARYAHSRCKAAASGHRGGLRGVRIPLYLRRVRH